MENPIHDAILKEIQAAMEVSRRAYEPLNKKICQCNAAIVREYLAESAVAPVMKITSVGLEESAPSDHDLGYCVSISGLLGNKETTICVYSEFDDGDEVPAPMSEIEEQLQTIESIKVLCGQTCQEDIVGKVYEAVARAAREKLYCPLDCLAPNIPRMFFWEYLE